MWQVLRLIIAGESAPDGWWGGTAGKRDQRGEKVVSTMLDSQHMGKYCVVCQE